MSYNQYEHPDITRALRTGYGSPESVGHSCYGCDADIGPGIPEYSIDGELCCEECFKDWVKEFLSSSPRELADAMGIENRLHQEGI